jgi:hypothetical protein
VVNRITDHRLAWLAVGVLAGMCISYFWPHEPTQAAATDRAGKFGLATVPVTSGMGAAGITTPESEGIFILDFLTGRMIGGVLNANNGKFSHSYAHNVFTDFNVNPDIDPNYAIVGGRMPMSPRGRLQLAAGVIYVAELSSGRVLAYGFPYEPNRPIMQGQLVRLDGFSFRAPAAAN